MIRYDRIGLATYKNKPFDSMDFKEKEALEFENLKIRIFFTHFRFVSVRFGSVRFVLGSH